MVLVTVQISSNANSGSGNSQQSKSGQKKDIRYKFNWGIRVVTLGEIELDGRIE